MQDGVIVLHPRLRFGIETMSDELRKPIEDELRKRIESELSAVQRQVELASAPGTGAAHAKEILRSAHMEQRREVLKAAHKFIVKNEDRLLSHFANGDEIDPAAIDPQVVFVEEGESADLFRFASLRWSVPVSAGYGRRTRFLIKDRQNSKVIGIFALGDPVIGLGPRDQAIGWNVEQRHKRLYSTYDAYVLGAVEPYRQLLGGKLAALAVLSNDVAFHLVRKYGGTTTIINEQQKDPTPALFTTTSSLGRSSVYNRLTLHGERVWHPVGFTSGFGHFQFSNDLFDAMRRFVDEAYEETGDESLRQSEKYGGGANWRFRVIRACLSQLGISEKLLHHGIGRQIFLAPAAANWQSYLCGGEDSVERLNVTIDEIGEYWRTRWAVGRAERRPQFRHWRREQMRLSPEFDDEQLRLSLSGTAQRCSVGLGPFEVSIGTDHVRIDGRTHSGDRSAGDAYLSHIVGPDTDFTFADITWANGERDVRGYHLGASHQSLESLLEHLRMPIHHTDRFPNLRFMEITGLRVPESGGRIRAVKCSLADAEQDLRIPLEAAISNVGEGLIGNRADLLSDDGRRRRQLCTLFSDNDRLTPALAYVLMRPILLLRQNRPEAPAPNLPRLAGQPIELPVGDTPRQ